MSSFAVKRVSYAYFFITAELICHLTVWLLYKQRWNGVETDFCRDGRGRAGEWNLMQLEDGNQVCGMRCNFRPLRICSTGWLKKRTIGHCQSEVPLYTLACDFARCWPIFRILSSCWELDEINSRSWYHCLPIGIYHWLREGDCIAAVCEVVCYMEVRPGLLGKKMRWHFSEQKWEWSDGFVMLR